MGGHLQFAPKELRADREIVLDAVSVQGFGWTLALASEELKSDCEIMMAAVSSSENIFKSVSAKDKCESQVVLATASDSGDALQYACEELRGDHGIMLAAVTDSGNSTSVPF